MDLATTKINGVSIKAVTARTVGANMAAMPPLVMATTGILDRVPMGRTTEVGTALRRRMAPERLLLNGLSTMNLSAENIKIVVIMNS